MRPRAVLVVGLLLCTGCAVGSGGSMLPYAAPREAASVVAPVTHGLGVAKVAPARTLPGRRAVLKQRERPASPAKAQAQPKVSHAATIYVVSDGKVQAFDEQGRRKATGGFQNMLSPADIAYDSHNRSLYVLDVVTQRVHAYDLVGRELKLPNGFAGLVSGTAIGYDANADAVCVAESDLHMNLTPRCFDAAGTVRRATATMPPKFEIANIPAALHPAGRVEAAVVVTH